MSWPKNHNLQVDRASSQQALDLLDRWHSGTADRPPVKALWLWAVAAARPPLFGVRRSLDRILPWRLLWVLMRWLVLALRDPLAKERGASVLR